MSKWGPLTSKHGSGSLNKVNNQASWLDIPKVAEADSMPKITINNAVQLYNQ